MEPRADEGERASRLEVLRIESHDLRSPIANIRSYVSMVLTRKERLDARTHRALEVIAKNADRALDLLDEWTEFLRAELGALELTTSPCSLGGLVRMAIGEESDGLQAKGIEVEVEIDDDLPSLELDAERIRKAVRALLSAARRRAPEGSRIRVDVRRLANLVEVEVRDRGPSPSPEEAARFFDPEFQMLAFRRMLPGIGMALAKAAVEAHGGEVGARPLPDGAIHYMRLPLTRM